MEGEQLIAVCGLYCGACGIYRAQRDNNQQLLEQILQALTSSGQKVTLDELQCDGCLGESRLFPYCRQCAIRLCPQDKPGVTRCSDCPDFPCSRITSFNDDGMRHHAEVLQNLRRIQEIGVKAWFKQEEERWRCPQCKTAADWYDRTCFQCGATQPRRLPSLPRDQK